MAWLAWRRGKQRLKRLIVVHLEYRPSCFVLRVEKKCRVERREEECRMEIESADCGVCRGMECVSSVV